MGWAKLDDKYAFHPKLVGDLEARGLDAAAISYCAGQETDGFVPDDVVMALGAGSRSPQAVAKRLVARRRWTRDDERKGYVIHDYLQFNPSRDELAQRREADRSRKGSGRNPPGNPNGIRRRPPPESDETPPGSRSESDGTPTGRQPDPPGARAQARIPTRPVTDVSQITPKHPGVVRNGEPFLIGRRVDDEPETGVVGYRQGSKTTELALRLASVCTAENRRLVDAEAVAVVDHVLAHVDWRVVDEAIGAYGSSGSPPTLPRALVPAVAMRAAPIEVPAFQPRRALA